MNVSYIESIMCATSVSSSWTRCRLHRRSRSQKSSCTCSSFRTRPLVSACTRFEDKVAKLLVLVEEFWRSRREMISIISSIIREDKSAGIASTRIMDLSHGEPASVGVANGSING